MTFRTKLMIVILLLVAGSVGFVGWAVSSATRDSFEMLDAQRTTALVEQFRREFTRRGQEIELRIAGIADTEATLRMALDLSRPQPDYALYVSDALGLSKSHQLDFLEMVATDGTVISSAHWSGRFGSKNEWVTGDTDWGAQGAFLMREELPDGTLALGLLAVRTVRVGESVLYIIGGRRVDREFLASFPLPEGMRALLYRNLSADFRPAELTDASGSIEQADRLAPFIESLRQQPAEKTETIRWDDRDAASEEVFHAIPLLGRQKELLGVLLAGSSRRQVVELLAAIREATFVAGGIGIAFGVLLSWWAAARVTRPVEQLAGMTRQVAAGRWDVRADAHGHDEVADLARAFNYMTAQLAEQRQRLVQAERVAAWRELARRLAHELKNPLFPLQITVENLQRAREQRPEQFDEVFQESCATLLAEL
ncbi:MAG TPA: HAMP domain-containing protein, partial [Candidatus Acidoferrales bacterium]